MPNEFIARNGIISRGSTSISGSFLVSGSTTIAGTQIASSGIGRTVLITSSLSASANNDVLVALDIQPSFNTGSFTVPATNRVGIRMPNQTFIQSANTTGTYYSIFGVDANNFATFGNANLNSVFAGSNLSFAGSVISFAGFGSATFMQIKASTTGNTSVGNYSFTLPDNGYRFQIYGSNSPSGSLYISGSSSQTLVRVDSDVSSSILFVTGSGRVGIGTNNPAYILDVSGSSRFNGIAYYGNGGLSLDVITASDPIWNGALRITGGAWLGTGGQRVRIGSYSTPVARLEVVGLGTTSATTTFLLQNSTPTNLMTVLDNGQFTISSPLISLAASQSTYIISQSISASNAVGGNYYAVNITPTFFQTTASQTETALRVAATFTQSSVLATGGTNIIADFGATSVGSQLTVTDVTSGSIYMVNDVSGLPIIEATSDWTVNMYNFPSIVLQKTGSQVNINGTLRVSGSFILPLSQSTAPQTGSAYWSGSLLFVWDGTRYRSSSFA